SRALATERPEHDTGSDNEGHLIDQEIRLRRIRGSGEARISGEYPKQAQGKQGKDGAVLAVLLDKLGAAPPKNGEQGARSKQVHTEGRQHIDGPVIGKQRRTKPAQKRCRKHESGGEPGQRPFAEEEHGEWPRKIKLLLDAERPENAQRLRLGQPERRDKIHEKEVAVPVARP